MNKKNHKVGEKASGALVPVQVDGWTLFVGGEGQHWIRDLDIADRAELEFPRDVRRTIETAAHDGLFNIIDDVGTAHDMSGAILLRTNVARPVGNKGGTTTTTVYYLNEEAALLLVTRLRTPKAVELTRAIVKVFMAVVRGQHASPAPAVTAEGFALAMMAIMRPVLTDALAPLYGRLAALEQQPMGGVVGVAVAGHVKRELIDVAALLHRCGQAKSVRSARTQLDNRLRGVVGWAGTACSWERLPAVKHGDTLRELDVMRRTAEGIAHALGRARQMPLKLVKP
jgi:hypothetical protein